MTRSGNTLADSGYHRRVARRRKNYEAGASVCESTGSSAVGTSSKGVSATGGAGASMGVTGFSR